MPDKYYFDVDLIDKSVISRMARERGFGYQEEGRFIRCYAADVAPVTHSKWVRLDPDNGHSYCDDCGCEFNIHAYESNDFRYCPSCGARMDKEGNG